jgi:hypothetical protein
MVGAVGIEPTTSPVCRGLLCKKMSQNKALRHHLTTRITSSSTYKVSQEHPRRSRKHGRGKYGFVRYLEQVYDQVTTWRETPGMAKKMRKQIAKSAKLPKVTRKKGLFNVIIAATSVEPTRTKSRWAQALRYAWKYRERRGKLSLLDFFKNNGGPAGCATKLSQGIKPRT